MIHHNKFLKQALQLAKSRLGFTAPNPAVGAVVVKNGVVIGEGFHYGAGYPHAEVGALKELDGRAKGADLYVTLEPCCHFGRTPPCTQLIVSSGISRVFFGFKDPNPVVAGKGQDLLQASGIACEQMGLSEVNRFYIPYAFWVQNKKPLVTVKIAMTKDGCIAGENKMPITISGDDCNHLTHENRLIYDAVFTTAETIIRDDPSMNVRLDGMVYEKPLYILDTHCRLPINAKIFQTAKRITIFHGKDASPKALKRLSNLGVTCIAISSDGQVLDLVKLLSFIGEEGVHALWVEVGARCADSFVSKQLCQQVIVYQSTRVMANERAYSFKYLFAALSKAGYHLSHQQVIQNDLVYRYAQNSDAESLAFEASYFF